MRFRVLGVVLSLVATQAAFAWNDLGHMVVASIAYARLNPSVKAECDRLLLVGGNGRSQTFVDAAPWADDVRRERPETGPWHYIDHHFRTDGKPTDMKPDAENVETALAKETAILADKSQSDAARADALRFIIHFVGDSHQPLHAVGRDSDEHPSGDKGGNDFLIVAPEGLVPKPKNLHSLWDQGCGLFAGKRSTRPLSADKTSEIATFAEQLVTNYGPVVKKASTNLSFQSWTLEGLEIAKTQVYSLPENTVPNEVYLNKGREISGKRVVLAGLRLSGLLNKTLG